MNILLIGAGGREHALAWKMAQSPLLSTLYAATPSLETTNPGIATLAKMVVLDVANHAAVIGFCQQNAIDLVVIGPEGPLVAGLSDDLRTAGIATFGPSAKAAQLEGSKGFTKDLCQRVNIPTATYARFAALEPALDYVRQQGAPIVIKADGLAAGKGVVVAMTLDEALEAVRFMFDGGMGAAGAAVVIEEFMEGEEVSFFALTDGTHILPLTSAQDHKRAFDGDKGPNTGGMGAYSPAPVLTPALEAVVLQSIIEPTVRAMREAGTPYAGVLYAGLMLTRDGPKLIEYNARFGDPECQVMMMRMACDIVPLLHAVARGTLAGQSVEWHDAFALTVVMAARGYPGAVEKGSVIGGLEDAARVEGVQIFHAGTVQRGVELCANGGRVLNISAIGGDVGEAQRAAYEAISRINWPQGFFRRDIGWRGV